MNVKEIASYTNLSTGTVYNLVYQKKIPFRRISERKVIFDKKEIDRWLLERKGDPEISEKMISREHQSPIDIETRAAMKYKNVEEPKQQKCAISQFETPISEQNIIQIKLLKTSLFRKLRYIGLSLLLIAAGWTGSRFYYQKATSHSIGESQSIDRVLSANIDVDSIIKNAEIKDLQVTPSYLDADQVKIMLDHRANIELRGDAKSDSIMPFLLYALKNDKEDYGTRSKTIDVIKPYVNDTKVRETLILVLQQDKDPAIRMKALTVLSKTAGMEDVKEAILNRLLHDDDEALRFKALVALENIVDAQIITALSKVKEKDSSNLVRSRAELIYNKQNKNI